MVVTMLTRHVRNWEFGSPESMYMLGVCGGLPVIPASEAEAGSQEKAG